MRLAIGSTIAAFALCVPAAHAGTVDVSGGTLSFTGGDEANVVAVYEHAAAGPNRVLVSESTGIPITLTDAARAAGCGHFDADDDGTENPEHAVCPKPGAVRIDGGAGNDRIALPPGIPGRADGDTGDDRLTGTPGADELHGGDGRDTLEGRAGDDELYGEGGDDLLHNNDGDDLMDGGDGDDVLGPSTASASNVADGADVLVGGSGTDEISYRPRTSQIRVSFDGQANDGRPAAQSQSDSSPPERDNVANDVEIVQGGGGTDVMVGDARANVFRGGGDFDQLRGGAGNDTLDGEEGGDIVHGEEGDDRLIAEAAVGGPGSDYLEARRQAHSRDGERDVVRCTSTITEVIADKLDQVSGDCKSIEREAPAPESKRPELISFSAPGGFTVAGLRKPGLFVKMRCPTGCTITARLVITTKLARKLRLGSRTVASARKTFRAGKVSLPLRLTRRAARRLREVPRWGVTVKGAAVSGDERFRLGTKFQVPFR